MTDARPAVAALLGSLEAVISMGGLGNRPGHMPHCNQGVWTSAAVIPDGAPCSKRCKEAHRAIELGRAWLASNADVSASSGRMEAAG